MTNRRSSVPSAGLHPQRTWNGSSWVTNQTVNYVYDGMRVIQERDGSNVPTVSYTRGRDLSGSLEGAGGIGGLLARSHGYSGGSWSTHNYYHADGGGNITMLIDASQVTVASYRYDPYGNTISSSGGLSAANLYRFSSKEINVNYPLSGLYYYGYRWYDPNLQRWLNRDPISEEGGINLYGFARNAPVNDVDPLGLDLELPHAPHWTPDDKAALQRILNDCKCYGDGKESDCAIVCTAFAQGGFFLGSAAYLMCVNNCERCGKTWLGNALTWKLC